MTLDGLLWLVVGGLTLAAAWLSLPRAPDLDWERFFKTALVTLIRGPLEAQGATAVAWLQASRERVWYHPGSRELAAKLADPDAYAIPVPARPGERALVEDLARLEGLSARLARTFTDEPRADEVLFEDPVDLGPAYDTVPVLGPEASWEAVSRWDDTVVAGLRRRLEHTRWVVLGDDGLAAVLAEVLGPERVITGSAETPEGLIASAEAWVPETSDRLVWLAVGAPAGLLARGLHGSAGLRDRTRAVVAVAAELGGETSDWLAEHFTHAAMDTELARTTPYFHLGFVAPETLPLGEPGVPLADTCWPVLDEPPNGRVAVEPVDLGVLPGTRGSADATLLVRALLLTLVQRLALSG